MLDFIKSYIKTGHRFYGVEHVMFKDKIYIYLYELKKTKSKLNTVSSQCFSSIEDVSKYIGKDKPVFLLLNTKDVLTKKVDISDRDNSRILNMAFPNVNPEEFCYEVLIQDEISYISICRKNVIRELLDVYNNKRVSIVDFSLGVLSSANVILFMENLDEVKVSNRNIRFNENKVSAIEELFDDEEFTYNINGIEITSKFFMSFTGALNLALNRNITQNNYNSICTDLNEDFKQRRRFKLTLNTSLIVLFVVLLGNFLIYNHYFSRLSSLKGNSQALKISKEEISVLSSNIIKSKKKVEDVQKTNASRGSYYIDRIIRSLPQSITLIELNYQPLKKQIQKGKPIEYELRTVIIEGLSLDSKAYSNWLKHLENYSWINTVAIINYSEEAGISTFNISIAINEKI